MNPPAIDFHGVDYTETQLQFLLQQGNLYLVHPGELPNHACKTLEEANAVMKKRKPEHKGDIISINWMLKCLP